MKVSPSTFLFFSISTFAVSPSFAQRDPTWFDWLQVKDHVYQRITDSSCPEAGSEDLVDHWDYDYAGYRAQGMTHEEALQHDCTFFRRANNPFALGMRLIRHAFHDSVGGFDGFVDLSDPENNGLAGSAHVLATSYDELRLGNDDGTTTPVKDILSFADFCAWAVHAALLDAVDKAAIRPGVEPMIPPVPVRYGRTSYVPTDDDDQGPEEHFPEGLGAQGSGQVLTTYFADEFGFDFEQTATIMGAHTLGTAAIANSGFHGAWTETRRHFDNGFQRNLVFPLPMNCFGQRLCTYFSEAGDDRNAPVEDMQTCTSGNEGRCLGWEQISKSSGGTERFQWSHSCKEDGSDCFLFMLNVDLGLMYDLEGYICSADDEANQVEATLGRLCKEGMIKGYPAGSTCDKATSRVAATCFDLNSDTSDYIVTAAEEQALWVEDFGPLFDRLLTHKLIGDLSADDLITLPCENDLTWTVISNNVARSCSFIHQQPETRCSLVGEDGSRASEACCRVCDGF